jgi:hypothetical protein
MYRFKSSIGSDMIVRFAHKGGKKGTKDKPGRAPKFTICYVIRLDGDIETVVGTGIAKPVQQVAEIVPAFIPIEDIPITFGKRFISSVKTDDGKIIAILRGDHFCRETGRKESLRKAVGALDKVTRENAWCSILGHIEEQDIIAGGTVVG